MVIFIAFTPKYIHPFRLPAATLSANNVKRCGSADNDRRAIVANNEKAELESTRTMVGWLVDVLILMGGNQNPRWYCFEC